MNNVLFVGLAPQAKKYNKQLKEEVFMFQQNKLSLALASIVTGVSIMGFSVPMYAQEDVADEMEEMMVTGSRIKANPNIESVSPITTVGSEEFLYRGVTRVEDLLNSLPQITGSNTSGDANGASGTATVDLRNLGVTRTLVLMNGRRLTNGSPQLGGGADLNFIPSQLLERVEVLTGGSSATYGSDAIAGVVNFQLRDDYEGFKIDAQFSGYQHRNDDTRSQQLNNDRGFDLPSGSVADGETFDISLIWGKNFAEGRGNISAYLNYRDVEAVTQSERDFSACAFNRSSRTGEISCGGSSTLPQGRFTDFAGGFDFIVQGNEFVNRQGELFNFAPNNYFQRPDERITTGILAHFDITDKLTAYTEFGYMNNETLAQIAPSGAFFVTDSLNCGNPLLSAQQFQALCGSQGLTAADTASVFIGRRNVEGGFRGDDLEHEQYRIVLGLKGEINDAWSFDTSFNYGRVDFDEVYLNDLSITNIVRALDVVSAADGSAVCRSVVNGTDPNCVPWNVFQTGGVTQDQTDYLVADLNTTGSTELINVIGFVSGDLTNYGLILPGADTGVQVVLGYEYREDNLDFNPNEGFTSGDGAGQGGPTPAVSGSIDASELFFEAKVPLFTDNLSLDLGYRYSDYNTGENTDTYKIALGWQVVDQLKLRASTQDSSRHANIRELFRPQSSGLFNGSDPCATAAPTATFEQCARSGVTADRFGTIAASPAGQYNQITGGNGELSPEESTTLSFGFVLDTDFGFDLTMDWYNIDVEDAISTAGAQFLLESCVFSNQFCDRINRGAVTQTLWLGADNIENSNANIGFLEREGIDVALNYKADNGISVNYNATFLTKHEEQPVPGEDIVDCRGKWGGRCSDAGSPDYRHTMRVTYQADSWVANIGWRHFGGVDEDTTTAFGDRFSAVNYIDLAGTYNFTEALGMRLGVNNIFDKTPPLSANSSNGNVNVESYDQLGRYFFIGFTYELL